jgi:hypothetical protein
MDKHIALESIDGIGYIHNLPKQMWFAPNTVQKNLVLRNITWTINKLENNS